MTACAASGLHQANAGCARDPDWIFERKVDLAINAGGLIEPGSDSPLVLIEWKVDNNYHNLFHSRSSSESDRTEAAIHISDGDAGPDLVGGR